MTRAEYVELYGKYYRLDTDTLMRAVGRLWDLRDRGDITVYNEHRIAARVLIERNRTGESLVFHLKNFLK